MNFNLNVTAPSLRHGDVHCNNMKNTRYLARRTRESGRATADFTKECQGIGDSDLAKMLPSADSAVGTGIFGIGLRRAANWMMAARTRLFDDVAQLLLSTQHPIHSNMWSSECEEFNRNPMDRLKFLNRQRRVLCRTCERCR